MSGRGISRLRAAGMSWEAPPRPHWPGFAPRPVYVMGPRAVSKMVTFLRTPAAVSSKKTKGRKGEAPPMASHIPARLTSLPATQGGWV